MRSVTILLLGLLARSVAPAAVLLTEGFDNVAALSGAGWTMTNNSLPPGSTGWFQGVTGIFSAHSGAPDSYVAANFLNADVNGGNISNWLLTPVLSVSNGDMLRFFTRSMDPGVFADRLEVRLSTSGVSTDVGATDDSVGDFTSLLATINPAMSPAGYPSSWTVFAATVSGIGAPLTGRYAFRYFVPDTLSNGDYIGIDSVSVETAIPEPGTLTMLGLGLAAAVFAGRRR